MAKRPLPSPAVVRQLLRYEPETGKLFWKKRDPKFFKQDGHNGPVKAAAIWNGRRAGKEAFTYTNGHGYKVGSMFDVSVSAQRVIWAIVHGEWWDGHIDHINRDRTDNRLCNLRRATAAQNVINSKIRVDNTSGVKGVSRAKDRWMATITYKQEQIYIGTFSTVQEAAAARKKKAFELFGDFANEPD